MRRVTLAISALLAGGTAALAATEDLTLQAVNSASFSESVEGAGKESEAFVIRVQVLLDRTNISPGAIDGIRGENLMKAIKTFEEREGLETDGEIDAEFWAALQKDNAPVLETYKITSQTGMAATSRKSRRTMLRWQKWTGSDFAVRARCSLSGSTWTRICSGRLIPM